MKDTPFYILLLEDIEKYGFEGLNETQQDEVKGLVMKAMKGSVETSEPDCTSEIARAVEKIDDYWRKQTQELQEKHQQLTESHQKLFARSKELEKRLQEAHASRNELTQERERILQCVEMIQYYWIEKGYFNKELMNTAFYYLRQGYNPFPKMRVKLDQWLEENNIEYYLQHDVFRFSLIRDL